MSQHQEEPGTAVQGHVAAGPCRPPPPTPRLPADCGRQWVRGAGRVRCRCAPPNSLLQAAFKGGLLLVRLVAPGGVLVTGPGHDETQHGVPGKHDLHQEHKRLFGVSAGGSRSSSARPAGCPAKSAKAQNGNSITLQNRPQVQHWLLQVGQSSPKALQITVRPHTSYLLLAPPGRRQVASDGLAAGPT